MSIIHMSQMKLASFAVVFLVVFYMTEGVAQGTRGDQSLRQGSGSSQPSSQRARDPGQMARVLVDGAAIYDSPNFDAPVLDYFERSRSVRISRTLYPGVGGLGAFYRIIVRPGVIGYITDVDVEIEGPGASQRRGSAQPAPEDDIEGNPLVLQPDLERPSAPQTSNVYSTRYLGLSYNMYDFTEKISGRRENANTSFFGLKMSGPGKMMGGAPLNLEFLVSPGAPSFYDKFGSASGFVILSHASIMIPAYDAPWGLIYYGFGPMIKYHMLDVDLANKAPGAPKIDSQELNLGFIIDLGVAIPIAQKYALRLEGRYNFEKEQYFALGTSFQVRF